MDNQTLLTFLRNRDNVPLEKWQKIPWHEPDFSRRMLREHLSQQHDHASRREAIIDQHVDWIHRKVLKSQPANILDLGCGPGLYVDRLTKLGHTCTGIDFSPASIEYAQREHAGAYRLGDVLTEDYGAGYDLVMMVFGELNAFSPEQAQLLIDKAYEALEPGGKLVLEVSRLGALERDANKAPGWYTSEGGLYSESPHLCLYKSTFDLGCLVTNYFVVVEGADEMLTYRTMHQAYTDDEYRNLLRAFETVMFYPSLTGKSGADENFLVIVAAK